MAKNVLVIGGEFIWNQLLEDMVNQRVDWVYLNLNWTTDFPASMILYYNVQLNGLFFITNLHS